MIYFKIISCRKTVTNNNYLHNLSISYVFSTILGTMLYLNSILMYVSYEQLFFCELSAIYADDQEQTIFLKQVIMHNQSKVLVSVSLLSFPRGSRCCWYYTHLSGISLYRIYIFKANDTWRNFLFLYSLSFMTITFCVIQMSSSMHDYRRILPFFLF